MAPTDRVQLPLRWQFVPTKDTRDGAVRWAWRAYTQTGKVALESAGAFDTLTESMADARKHGHGA